MLRTPWLRKFLASTWWLKVNTNREAIFDHWEMWSRTVFRIFLANLITYNNLMTFFLGRTSSSAFSAKTTQTRLVKYTSWLKLFFTLYNLFFLLLEKSDANIFIFPLSYLMFTSLPLSPSCRSLSVGWIGERGQWWCSGERAFVSRQYRLTSSTGVDTIWGLSLSLILFSVPRGSCTGHPVFHSLQKTTFPNSSSIWKVCPVTSGHQQKATSLSPKPCTTMSELYRIAYVVDMENTPTWYEQPRGGSRGGGLGG